MEKVIHKSNILLLKDDVGKSKPSTFRLPPQGFVYGKPDSKDQDGADKLTSSWLYHNNSHNPTKGEIDFRKVNKYKAF